PPAARSTRRQGSSPPEAPPRIRAGWELCPFGSVSWLADRRSWPPSQGVAPQWPSGQPLPAHSCATAPDSHRLPCTREAYSIAVKSAPPGGAAAGRWRPARRPPRASGALLHLEDLVGDQAVRLAVHARRGLRVRRLDQAEHLALLGVDPVPEV